MAENHNNDASDDDRPQIASVFASLKKGAERAGPAPPLINGPPYAPPEIKALYPRLDETTTLDDAQQRERARNASLIKPNRRAMRPRRDWPSLAFPQLKKTIEPHVPLPKALAWTGLRTNRYARDDPVLRYVPYFGDDDTTGVTSRPTTRARRRRGPRRGCAGPRPCHPSSKRVERTRAPCPPRSTRRGIRVRRRPSSR